MILTMGSPFGAIPHPNSAAPGIRTVLKLLDPKSVLLSNDELHDRALTPPPVPTTSIYTMTDGIVNWKTCINPEDDLAENIRVIGGHTGLVVNASAVLILADRLAQDAETWQPFNINDYNETLTENIREHTGYTPDMPPPHKIQRDLKIF
jgi:hypothetical protein